MHPQVPSGRKTLDDHPALQSAADPLGLIRKSPIRALAPKRIVKQPDHVDDILAPILRRWRSPVIEINHLRIEEHPAPSNDHIARVHVPVILAPRMDLLKTHRKRVQQTHRLEHRQTLPRLTLNEVVQNLPLDVLADQRRHRTRLETNRLRVVVLHQQRAITQPLQLARIPTNRLIPFIPMREKQLRGTRHARPTLTHPIHLTLITPTQHRRHGVVTTHRLPRLKRE